LLSNASHETGTIRVIRLSPSPATSCTTAPPVSLPTSVTSSRSSSSSSSRTRRAIAGSEKLVSARTMAASHLGLVVRPALVNGTPGWLASRGE
jgi:hypothetical protein